MRRCYEGVERDGEVIRIRDTVLLRSGPRKKSLPYVAKISALWEDPKTGNKSEQVIHKSHKNRAETCSNQNYNVRTLRRIKNSIGHEPKRTTTCINVYNHDDEPRLDAVEHCELHILHPSTPALFRRLVWSTKFPSFTLIHFEKYS